MVGGGVLVPARHAVVNVNRIYAGTTGALEYELAGYPVGDGWTSEVVLRHYETQEVITLGAVGDGESYTASYDEAASALWKFGKYRVYIYAIKPGSKNVVAEYALQILADPSGDVVQTPAEVELAAVKKAIAGVLAGEGVKSYTFETSAGRRSADRMELHELRAHQRQLERTVATERAQAEGRPNPYGRRTISARFNR